MSVLIATARSGKVVRRTKETEIELELSLDGTGEVDVQTGIGMFDLRYNGSFYETFEQTATGALSTAVLAAKEADPTIVYPIVGLGDLLGIDGNQESRHSASINWQNETFSASVQGFRISSFDEVLSNGDLFPIPSMTTFNTKFDYRFNVADTDMQRLMISWVCMHVHDGGMP